MIETLSGSPESSPNHSPNPGDSLPQGSRAGHIGARFLGSRGHIANRPLRQPDGRSREASPPRKIRRPFGSLDRNAIRNRRDERSVEPPQRRRIGRRFDNPDRTSTLSRASPGRRWRGPRSPSTDRQPAGSPARSPSRGRMHPGTRGEAPRPARMPGRRAGRLDHTPIRSRSAPCVRWQAARSRRGPERPCHPIRARTRARTRGPATRFGGTGRGIAPNASTARETTLVREMAFGPPNQRLPVEATGAVELSRRR